MLDYIQNNSVSDEMTKEVDEYVSSVKAEPTIKEGYMTLGDHFDIEREEGRQEGQRIFIFELLKEKGNVSSELRDYINQVSDPAELSRIHKLASKASSIEEFEKAAELVIQ